MYPRTHLIWGFIFSLAAVLIFPEIGLIGFFTIWAASVLIDVDHYLFYVWDKKDLSLKRAHKWFMDNSKRLMCLPKTTRKKSATTVPCIFHGIETLLVLMVLAFFFHRIFLYILIGFAFHQLLDFIHIAYYGFNFNHIGSQTYNIINHKKSKGK